MRLGDGYFCLDWKGKALKQACVRSFLWGLFTLQSLSVINDVLLLDRVGHKLRFQDHLVGI